MATTPTLERFIADSCEGSNPQRMRPDYRFENERFTATCNLTRNQIFKLVKQFYADCFEFGEHMGDERGISVCMQPKDSYLYKSDFVLISISGTLIGDRGWKITVLDG